MKKLMTIYFVSVLAGCATAPPTPTLPTASIETFTPSPQKISLPATDTPTTVEVGQSIISSALVTRVEVLSITEPQSQPGINIGRSFAIEFPVGTLKKIGSDSAGSFFSYDNQIPFNVSGSVMPVNGGLYIPNDATTAPSAWWLSTHSLRAILVPSSTIKYKKITTNKITEESFKRELIYTGLSGNTLSLAYREFKNDLARPAFSQDLRYDLEASKTIGYNGARFDIIKATNLELTYVVRKHLE